jgi:hypothetical protein
MSTSSWLKHHDGGFFGPLVPEVAVCRALLSDANRFRPSRATS